MRNKCRCRYIRRRYIYIELIKYFVIIFEFTHPLLRQPNYIKECGTPRRGPKGGGVSATFENAGDSSAFIVRKGPV